jgi:twitching motility protein PilI
MAARTDLRKFQQSLIERLSASSGQSTLNTKLGFEIADDAWLIDLTGISEVLPVPYLEPVPLARKWLAGVANIRGHLFTVVDLASFFGKPLSETTASSRLLLLSPRVARGVALQVKSTYGLRHETQFQVDQSHRSEREPWVKCSYRDNNGRRLCEIDPHHLVAHPSFLDVSE